MNSETSVAVVGAGPAGAMAALLLARAGLRVLLIGRPVRRHSHIAEMLSPDGMNELAAAGLWDRLPPHLAVPCPAVASAWERSEPTWHPFITNPYGCAWHIHRPLFDTWLTSQAEAAGALFVSAIVTGIRWADCQWAIDVRRMRGELYVANAEFLVVATGRYGFTSSLSRREHIDALCLIGGLAEPAADAGDWLLVEAVPDGWWYSAPAINGRMFAGWMTDPNLRMATRLQDAMLNALARAPLTQARLAGSPQACSVGAASSAIERCAGKCWIAIGDAALARDPISGEGLACALRSAREGTATILKFKEGESTAWDDAYVRGVRAVARYRNQRWLAYTAAYHRWPNEAFWSRRVGLGKPLLELERAESRGAITVVS